MPSKLVVGDLLCAKEDLIVQQVNHAGVMGAGLALKIRSKWPGIFDPYKNFCNTYDFEATKASGMIMLYDIPGSSQKVVCLFGQRSFGFKYACYTDYLAVENGLLTVAKLCEQQGYTVALPFNMGCTLAGGDWDIVFRIIERTIGHFDPVIYRLEK